MVQKVKCRNHLLRNFCNKIADVCSRAGFGTKDLRMKVKSNILKLKTADTKAIKFRKNEEGFDHSQKSVNLKNDLLNILQHEFEEHEKCVLKYFCTKTAPDSDNLIPTLKKCGLYQKLMEFW
ncbi:unnamed protein product [Psylliodes chrysocephalus]|uniref:Mutator-like transposase domain-containing protein n=1 Tax=Psylliodes chrysocephalus TaxID=3402493 RepID=A0A9P0G9T7_9CUCU|nr:unnamed protein product [Psylliodes chrysocephala]